MLQGIHDFRTIFPGVTTHIIIYIFLAVIFRAAVLMEIYLVRTGAAAAAAFPGRMGTMLAFSIAFILRFTI